MLRDTLTKVCELLSWCTKLCCYDTVPEHCVLDTVPEYCLMNDVNTVPEILCLASLRGTLSPDRVPQLLSLYNVSLTLLLDMFH